MNTKADDSLKKYSYDLLALETHFMKAVKNQKGSDSVKDEYVIELLHEMDKKISGHVSELEEYVEKMGEKPKSGLKTKIASLAGSLTGLFDETRSDTVSKMLRDDYTALSMITIGYTMLHTYALAEEQQDLADLTIQHMERCTSLITEISKVVPLAVANEIIDDNEKAAKIGQKALDNTQKAWKPEIVNKEPNVV